MKSSSISTVFLLHSRYGMVLGMSMVHISFFLRTWTKREENSSSVPGHQAKFYSHPWWAHILFIHNTCVVAIVARWRSILVQVLNDWQWKNNETHCNLYHCVVSFTSSHVVSGRPIYESIDEAAHWEKDQGAHDSHSVQVPQIGLSRGVSWIYSTPRKISSVRGQQLENIDVHSYLVAIYLGNILNLQLRLQLIILANHMQLKALSSRSG